MHVRARLTGASVMVAVASLASGCLGAGSPQTQDAHRCHVHSSSIASARTAHYQLLVGLGPAQLITPTGGASASPVSAEAGSSTAAAATALGRAHLDVEICTTSGVPAQLGSVPVVRLTDGGVASIDVPVTRLRRVDENEPAHFGANIALVGDGPMLATITVDGEQTSVLLRALSAHANP